MARAASAAARGRSDVAGRFRAGERVLLVDRKRRRHLVTLEDGGVYHLHTGTLPHDEIIGVDEGTTVRTSLGARMVATRPTLGEYVLEMPRGAQVVYPKDLGPLLMLADARPGDLVFESGVGSGALTMALARAVLPGGRILGYEAREDFAERARANIEGYFGAPVGASEVPVHIEIRSAYEGIDPEHLDGRQIDKMVLDLPEPWQLVEHAEHAMRAGGILVAYLPTIGQVARLCEELSGSRFELVETLEVLQRTWRVKEPSVRPDHRMVAHTGFLTHARLLAPEAPED